MDALHWFLKTLALSILVSGCGKSSVEEVLSGANAANPAEAGVVNAERTPEGTVSVIFKGFPGTLTYTLHEDTLPPKAAASLWSRVVNLFASAEETPVSTRELATLADAGVRNLYTNQSSQIPFGGRFCYRVVAHTKEKGDVALGSRRCLSNDENWQFPGIEATAADEVGRVVIKWLRIPAQGATYEVLRKISGDASASYATMNRIVDGAQDVDELLADSFPRCYMVKVSHPLFSQQDANSKEICLSLDDYNQQRNIAADVTGPQFDGIEKIEATRPSGVLDNLAAATGISSGIKVILSWKAGSDNLTRPGRIRYQVYRSPTSFGFDFQTPYATTKGGELTYTDSSLEKGKMYFYLVRAVDENGNQDQNMAQKKLPLDVEPPSFAGLLNARVARTQAAARVDLEWNIAQDNGTPSSGIVYKIYRSENPTRLDTVLATVNGNTSYTDTTTLINKVYYYKVKAFDQEENEDSNTAVLQATTMETPPAFEGATSAALFQGVGVVRWNPAEDDETPSSSIVYRIYRRTEEEEFNFRSALFQTVGGALQFNDNSVNPNLTYFYVVTAVDERGYESTDHNEIEMLANQAPRIPSAPTVQWMPPPDRCMKVSWPVATDDSTSSTRMQYKIFRADSPSLSAFNFTRPLDTLDSGRRSYMDCSVDGQRGYSYIIRAVDQENAEGPSSAVGTIAANQLPSAGTVSRIELGTGTNVTIAWNAGSDDRTPPSLLRYKVYRFLKATQASPSPVRVFSAANLVGTVDPGVQQFVDPSGLSATEEYSWVVRPVDEFFAESDSQTEYSLGDNLAPAFNGITSVSVTGLRTVTLTWPLATDDRTPRTSLSYKIYVAEAPPNTPTGTDPNNPIPDSVRQMLFVSSNVQQTIQGEVTTLSMPLSDMNKTWVFGIRAFDQSGLSDTNTSMRALPANQPPQFSGLAELNEGASGVVRLNWNAAIDDKDNSSEIVYRVYRLSSSNATETGTTIVAQGTVRTSNPGSTTFDDDSVNPASYNHYVVRALDRDIAEDTNTVVKSVAPDGVKPVFLGVKNSSMEGKRITLVWDAATDNRTVASKIKYNVYRSMNGNLADILATQPITNPPLTNGVLSFSDTPPTDGRYYYVVRALDEAGNSDLNERVAFTVDVVPPEFGGLVSGFAITNTTAQVFWSNVPNSDVAKVNIYRAEDLANPLASVAARDLAGNWQNSYLVTGLLAATQYTFVARASDAYDNEEKNTVPVVVTTLAGAAPTFAGLEKVEVTRGVQGVRSLDLTWPDADGATHFRIFRVMGASESGTNFDFDWSSCSTRWGSPDLPGCTQIAKADVSMPYAVTGLSKATRYSFIVRAVSLSDAGIVLGEERNRVIRTATTLDEVAPTFAGALSAVSAAGASGVNSVAVKWGDPDRDGVYDGFTVVAKNMSGSPSATSFTLPGDLTSDPTLLVYAVSDGSLREQLVTGLTYQTRYCFTVLTRYSSNLAVRSIPSPTTGFVCASPEVTPPDFAGVHGQATKGAGANAFSQITVSWDAALGSFSEYEVSWSTTNDYVSAAQTGSFFGDIARTATVPNRTTTQYTISGLTPNTTYYIRVRARFSLSNPAVTLTAGSERVTQETTMPIAPSGDGLLSVTQATDDQVNLSFAGPNNGGLINRYYVFRAMGSTAESDLATQLSPDEGNTPPYAGDPLDVVLEGSSNFTTRTYSDQPVPEGRACYVVRAAFQSISGFVGSSNSTTKCVEVAVKPPEFTGISSVTTPATSQGFTTLVAHWQPATGNFTRYEYRIGQGADVGSMSGWNAIAGARDTTTSVTIGSLQPYTTYYIQVRALYLKGAIEYGAGEVVTASGTTVPKAPVHAGLNPPAYLTNPGDVRISWTVPSVTPEVGGLFNRFLVWKLMGEPSDILAEISTLLSNDSIISEDEVANSNYHITSVGAGTTEIEYSGTNRLQENTKTCFLARAAYLSGTNFVMSDNQTIRCVTPTASAPMFGGLADLKNIPLNVNGFSQLQATWLAASGNFTRYEFALAPSANSITWATKAALITNKDATSSTVSNLEMGGSGATALRAHTTYYGRVRAVYQGSDGTLYAAGDSSELSQMVRPDIPTGDGIIDVDVSKTPGVVPQARISMRGNVGGFWNKVAIWRSVNLDLSLARSDVMAKAAGKSDNTGFVGAPLTYVQRVGSSTADLTFTDTGIQLGKWNCYAARATYMDASNFITSNAPADVVCRQPNYNPINFNGLAAAGSEVCALDNPQNSQPCNPDERWPNTGNSMVRLKFDGIPQGDIDFYDVYMGTDPDANALIASGVFQTILKGDALHDALTDDTFLLVGGGPKQYLAAGQVYFLVRARCLGCGFGDSNTKVSNAVTLKKPWIRTAFDFQNPLVNGSVRDLTGSINRLEDPSGAAAIGSQGTANLGTADDYLRATDPGVFAPQPNRTLAFKFTLSDAADSQNLDHSALFAADSSAHEPYWTSSSGQWKLREGAHLARPGAVTVFDARNKECLYIGGYAGDGHNEYDYPWREWHYHPMSSNKANALRMQRWDGANLSETYQFERDASPLPRSLPVTAYNPKSETVYLFGGWDQSTPQLLRSDTWEWDGLKWKKIGLDSSGDQTVAGQMGRYADQVMAWDPFSEKMTMVGGRYRVPNRSTATTATSISGLARADVWSLHRDVRNQVMVQFERNSTTGAMEWTNAGTLPGTFPRGAPASLVSVPTGTGKGLWYISAEPGTSAQGYNQINHNLWFYNGSVWAEIGSSALPDNGMAASLTAAWDPVRERIFVTFTYGNSSPMRVWEYNPAQRDQGQSAWTKRYSSNAPVHNGGWPACLDTARSQLVVTGGVWYGDPTAGTQARMGTDVFLFDTQSSTWTLSPFQAEPHGDPGVLQAYDPLKGVVQVGEYPRGMGDSIGWWESTYTRAVFLFLDGFWKQLRLGDKEYRPSSGGVWKGVYTAFPYRTSNHATVDLIGNKLVRFDVAGDNETDAVVGRGLLSEVDLFDSTGWTRYRVTGHNILWPDDRCPNRSVWQAPYNTSNPADGNYLNTLPAFRPHQNMDVPWTAIWTPWGILAKPGPFGAIQPYEFSAASGINCSGGATWRYSQTSPMVLAVPQTSNPAEYRLSEIKSIESSDYTTNNPHKWCSSVTTVGPDLRPEYKRNRPFMIWDDAGQQVVLFGYHSTTSGWPEYTKYVQAIRYNTSSSCFYVVDLTSPFPDSSWTVITPQYAWYPSSYTHDRQRNVLLTVSDHWTTSTRGGSYPNIDGMIWELDWNAKVWRARNLPAAYTRTTALAGNPYQRLAPIPGKPGEFLLRVSYELHSNAGRNEDYILTVTGSEIKLRPVLPRMGITLGADRRSAYVSVPGDRGEADGTVGGETIYSGRRKFSDDLVGTHTLFLTFGTNSYAVYLDDSATPAVTGTYDPTQGFYLSEFVLGARYGVYARFSDPSVDLYKGIGNTKVSFDWVRTFEKTLSATERSFWHGFDDDAEITP